MTHFFKNTCMIIGTACVLTLTSSTAQAERHIIGISPMQETTTLEQQKAKILDYAINHVGTGDSLLLMDALNSRIIGEFTVPDKAAYQHPRAKVNINKAFIVKLKQFSVITIPDNNVAGALNVPRFMDFLGKNHAPFDDSRIMLIGSPIYVSSASDNVSMKDGYYYKDGAFNAPPSQSVLSLHGRENTVPTTIHWLIDTSLTDHQRYAHYVTRMWTLYLEGHGAKLASFDADATTVWTRFAADSKAHAHAFTRDMDADTTALENIAPLPQISVTLPAIYDRALSTTKPDQATLRKAGNVEVAVSWDCEACDLDLYVRHGAEIIYHNNRQTAHAIYNKNYAPSPDTKHGFEQITFTKPIDLQDVMVGVNWASGESSKGVRGEIRLSIDGATYAKPFTLDRDINGAHASSFEHVLQTGTTCIHWAVLDPKTIIGL